MQESFEDQLAAAFVAKMAGSTLLQIDNQTTQHSNQGRATRIDPKSFLTSIQQKQQDHRRAETEQLHDLAEKMHPLPPPIQPLPSIEPLPPITPIINNDLLEVLKSIDSSLKDFVSHYKQIH
jgi:hypothetical protein